MTRISEGPDLPIRDSALDKRGRLLHAGQATERAPLRDPPVATPIRDRTLHTRTVIGVARLTGCHQDAVGAAPCSK